MSDYKIEKNIPIPPEEAEDKTEKYPFDGMEVGDSFLVECEPSMRKVYRSTLEVAALDWAIRRESKAKFTARDAFKGVRVWRVK